MLDGIFYSEHYEEETAQQEVCDIAAWKDYVTVNVKWKLFHSDCSEILYNAIYECSVQSPQYKHIYNTGGTRRFK